MLDGCAMDSGALLGKLYVNTNFGEVYELDLATNARALIASGGSRGDFVTGNVALHVGRPFSLFPGLAPDAAIRYNRALQFREETLAS